MAIDDGLGVPFLAGVNTAAPPPAEVPCLEGVRPAPPPRLVPFLEGPRPAERGRAVASKTRVAPSDRCGEATRRICACSLAQCPEAPPVRGAVLVPLGVMAVSDDPAAALEVSALGSCIGLALHDPEARVAAMAHVFLPSSRETRRSGCDRGKYADTVVPTLLEAVLRLGARRERLRVYLAGGGQLTGARPLPGASTIGEANDAAVRGRLSAVGLSPTAARTGGSVSRSLRVDLATGAVTTRAIGGETERL